MHQACASTAEDTVPQAILHDLGYCGHYLHCNTGGRGGQIPILCKLEKNGGELSQHELQEMFEIKSGSMSEVLAKMEADGLIRRDRLDDDRRQMTAILTEKGHEQAKDHMARRHEFEAEAFSPLAEEEQRELLELLDKVASHWKELECRN